MKYGNPFKLIFWGCFWLGLAGMILDCRPVFAESTVSPNGKISVEIGIKDGLVQYTCQYDSVKVIEPSLLGWQTEKEITDSVIVKTNMGQVNRSWTPLWGERQEVPDRYNFRTVFLRGKYDGKPISWQIELRVYDEGFAFCYLLPDRKLLDKIEGEKTEFRLPENVSVYPINSTEATYSEDPVALKNFKRSYAPLTGKFSDGRAFSIMEACAIDYPRFQLYKNERGSIWTKVPPTAIKPSDKPFQSAWRLVLLAENERDLIEKEYAIFNLNPAPTEKFDWVNPGLTISNEGNCPIVERDLKSMVDFAAENNMKYIQIDWGWYGTEWGYTDAECEEWAKNNPSKANDPTWRANTKPTPYKVAKGLVPYFPRFKASTYVDIDVDKLVQYGKSKGIGICLYLNDRMIKKYDIKDLFAVYEKWGLAGLKPGFVAYGSAENSDQIRYLAQTAAKHKLWLCIHDAYLPDGMSRTFPNVTCVEGGGGQEGNHPVHHDVVLPFTRGLVGPFDFTPKFYVKGRSNAHQMSLLTTLYNPTPVIRGGWRIRDSKSGLAFGSEIEFFKHFQSKWLETKVLDGSIGKYIVTARKAESGEWVLGATNGTAAVTRSVSLAFLNKGTDYEMTLWTDAPEEKDGGRPTVKTVRKVNAEQSVDLPLAPGGGAVAVFKPIEKGDYWCYFGSYTNPLTKKMKELGSVETKGILVARYDSNTGKFSSPRPVAEIGNPSWLTLSEDQKTLYSVGEGSPANGTANVTSWRINSKDGSLELLNKEGTGGGSPCHLALSPEGGQFLVASNYGGGDFVFYRIGQAGKIGPETDRFLYISKVLLPNGSVRKPHGHAAAFSQRSFDAGYRVYLSDLGNDRVHVGFLNKETGKFSIDKNIVGLDTAAEAGPRHLVVDSFNDHDLVLVVNENSSNINVYRVYDKRVESLGAVFTLLPKSLEGKVTWRKNLVDGKKFTQYNACGEIMFDKNRNCIYATNRGHDSIAVFHYNSKGKKASEIIHVKEVISSGGSFPRNIEIDPTGRFMIVSNQLEGTVLTFARDLKNGLLKRTDNPPLLIGYPLAILFVPVRK